MSQMVTTPNLQPSMSQVRCSRWWFFTTHLKNLRPSNWRISLILGVKKITKYWKPPPSVVSFLALLPPKKSRRIATPLTPKFRSVAWEVSKGMRLNEISCACCCGCFLSIDDISQKMLLFMDEICCFKRSLRFQAYMFCCLSCFLSKLNVCLQRHTQYDIGVWFCWLRRGRINCRVVSVYIEKCRQYIVVWVVLLMASQATPP